MSSSGCNSPNFGLRTYQGTPAARASSYALRKALEAKSSAAGRAPSSSSPSSRRKRLGEPLVPRSASDGHIADNDYNSDLDALPADVLDDLAPLRVEGRQVLVLVRCHGGASNPLVLRAWWMRTEGMTPPAGEEHVAARSSSSSETRACPPRRSPQRWTSTPRPTLLATDLFRLRSRSAVIAAVLLRSRRRMPAIPSRNDIRALEGLVEGDSRTGASAGKAGRRREGRPTPPARGR
jgi:hypothetical protein